MKHAEVKRNLAGYLEGELPIAERALVDAHLDDCGECAREVEEMLQTIRLLRKLPEPEIPPMIAANVMRRIRAGENQPGFFERITRTIGGIFEPGFVLPASAIAAAALVITVVQGLGELPGTQDMNAVDGGVARSTMPADSAVASMAPPIGASRAAPRSSADVTDVADVAARVERRAVRLDGAALRRGVAAAPVRVQESAPQIRIQLDQFLVAQQADPQRVANSSGPILVTRVPAGWAMARPGVRDGRRSGESSGGTLVAATREGSIERSTGDAWAASADIAGTDPRDAWLALGFEDPAEFARYIAAQNLAEQELWAARLSARAESRGLLGEFLRTLRDSGDPTAAWVADDFAAQVEREAAASSSGGSAPLR